jgi:hypothetical protein
MISDQEILQYYDPTTKRTWIKFVLQLMLFLVPFAPAIAFLYLIIRDFIIGLLSLRWKEGQGVIIVSAIEGGHFQGEVGTHRLFYEFTVDQKEYLGYRNKIGGGTYSNTIWDEVHGYQRGDIVSVFYNPNNPEQSVLHPGIQWDNFLMLIFIPLITLFQLLFFAVIHLTLWDMSWLFDLFGL